MRQLQKFSKRPANEALRNFTKLGYIVKRRRNPDDAVFAPLRLEKFSIDGGPRELFICRVCFW